VAAEIDRVSFLSLKIYSLTEVNVSISPLLTSDVNTSFTYQYVTTKSNVKLIVLNKEVDADGFLADVNFTINSKNGFGEYILKVSNSVGTTTTTIEIVTEGREFCVVVFLMYISRLSHSAHILNVLIKG